MVPLSDDVVAGIVDQTAVFESNGNFSAVNRDGEFEGRFNRPNEEHPAFETYHIGLSYGIVQFTQDSGMLGRLLEMMHEADADRFFEVFGEHSDELLVVTNTPGPASRRNPPRGARIREVDGADLWQEPWVSRFRAAGDVPSFQAAQRTLAAEHFLVPMLTFAGWLGLNTDRALSIVFDRAIQQGKGGARRWIMGAVGPIENVVDAQEVLSRYGFSSIEAFQEAIAGLRPDGDWGPKTHAALCWFERQRSVDDEFVMHVPSRKDMIDMMVNASVDRRWGHRVERLRDSTEFSDIELDLLNEATVE